MVSDLEQIPWNLSGFSCSSVATVDRLDTSAAEEDSLSRRRSRGFQPLHYETTMFSKVVDMPILLHVTST
jgi:hypothetical protein